MTRISLDPVSVREAVSVHFHPSRIRRWFRELLRRHEVVRRQPHLFSDPRSDEDKIPALNKHAIAGTSFPYENWQFRQIVDQITLYLVKTWETVP